jgi:hypothetical protein
MRLEEIQPYVLYAMAVFSVIAGLSIMVFLFRLWFFHRPTWRKLMGNKMPLGSNFYDEALRVLHETEPESPDGILYLSLWLAKAALWPIGLAVLVTMGFWCLD